MEGESMIEYLLIDKELGYYYTKIMETWMEKIDHRVLRDEKGKDSRRLGAKDDVDNMIRNSMLTLTLENDNDEIKMGMADCTEFIEHIIHLLQMDNNALKKIILFVDDTKDLFDIIDMEEYTYDKIKEELIWRRRGWLLKTLRKVYKKIIQYWRNIRGAYYAISVAIFG